jgi:predicted site-specific integrase-resolvase
MSAHSDRDPDRLARQHRAIEELLPEKAAAEALHISVKTLQAWRVRGCGPEFVKLGRRILYRASSLQRHIEEHTYRSTSAADYARRSNSEK